MNQMDTLEVSIVIPVYNEEKVIGSLLEGIVETVHKMKEHCEVIVVNDHSKDQTTKIIRKFAEAHKVILIDSHNSQGKGGALRAGFDLSRGRTIVMMDGDGSHQASDIPKLVEEQRKTNGLVIASRIYGGSEEFSRLRATGNLFLTWLFGMLHGRYLSDALNGFKAFSADIYQSFEYSSNGYEIEIELLSNTLKLGRPITEVPSLELRRQGGEVKSRIVKDGFKFLWRIIFERFKKKKARTERT